MGLFEKQRLRYGLHKLKKQGTTLKRNRRVYNLDTARTAGVLCPAQTDETFEQAIGLAHFLLGKNIEVSLLIYCPLKEVPQSFLLRRHVNVFNVKELNWFRKPVAPIADEFIQREFDLLIDLSLAEHFPVRWVATLSRAKFKVGALNFYGSPNDLIMSIGKNAKTEYLIEQIKHYLNLLNNRFAQEKQQLVE